MATNGNGKLFTIVVGVASTVIFALSFVLWDKISKVEETAGDNEKLLIKINTKADFAEDWKNNLELEIGARKKAIDQRLRGVEKELGLVESALEIEAAVSDALKAEKARRKAEKKAKKKKKK